MIAFSPARRAEVATRAGNRCEYCHLATAEQVATFLRSQEQLTDTSAGSMRYRPAPSTEDKWLLYGSKRDGVRHLYLMRLSDRKEWRITDLARGRAAMWASWQPRHGQ